MPDMAPHLDLSRWKDAATATARSGLLRPPGPRASAKILSGLWRTGLTPATVIAINAARHPDRPAIVDDERVEREPVLHLAVVPGQDATAVVPAGLDD